MSGKIKWYDQQRGYGFIERPGLDDIYLHHTGLASKRDGIPSPGDTVTFDESQGERGPKAVNARVTARAIAPSTINSPTIN